MIAARDFTHNGRRYTKGAKVHFPEEEAAMIERMGFIVAEPEPKAPAKKGA